MKLNQIRDVIAVAERGSLRAAARHLRVAQPALSRSIQELERELGAPLFERRARGAVLTPIGTLFLRRAGAIMSEVRRARDEIEQAQGGTAGSVVVCSSSVPLMSLMPHVLQPFRARFPDVRVRLLEGPYPVVESDLKNGTMDFYVGPAPGTPLTPDLVSETLFQNTRTVFARKGHSLARATALKDLVDAEWIVSAIAHHAEDEIAAVFARLRLPPPRIVMQAQSALSLLVAVANTDVLALLPVQWTEFAPTRVALVELPIREKLAAPAIVLVRRSGLPLTPAAEHFCDLLRREGTRLQRRAER